MADIKRANGLLSDSAMFAKDKLLIPTQAMPPMGSVALLCARLQSLHHAHTFTSGGVWVEPV